MVIVPARSGSLKEKALRLGFSFLDSVLAAGSAGAGVRGRLARAGMPSREARKFLRCIWQVLDLNLGKYRD